jgi:hypothetical protein
MKMNRRKDTILPHVCLYYEVRHVSCSRFSFFSEQPESRSESLTGEAGSSTESWRGAGGGQCKLPGPGGP